MDTGGVPKTCLVCRKVKKTPGSFFCRGCFKENIYTKLYHFQRSPEFKRGSLGVQNNRGRLPTKEERETEPMTQEEVKKQLFPFWRKKSDKKKTNNKEV